MIENYESLAFDFLSKYSVGEFVRNVAYARDVSLPRRLKLTSENIQILRMQLKKTDADYMVDGFLMDLVLSKKTSREEKIGLVQLMQKEDEIASGLKALERRNDLDSEDIQEIIKQKKLSRQTLLLYNF